VSIRDACCCFLLTIHFLSGAERTAFAQDSHTESNAPRMDLVRKVLFEEFTGEWCSLCPGGSIEMDHALRVFAGRVVPITYHDNDPLEVRDLNAMLDSIPLDPLYPGGTFDRLPYAISNPKHKMSVDRTEFLSTLEKAAARTTHVGISAVVSVDRSARLLAVQPNVEFLARDTGDFRVQCVVTENGVRRDNMQRNAYDKDPASYPQLFGAGDPLRMWSHYYVARAILGGPTGRAGTIPLQPVVGQGYVTDFVYSVPSQMNIDSLGVAVFVVRYEHGSLTGNEVLNAEGYLACAITEARDTPAAPERSLFLYPNPCDGIVWLRDVSFSGAPVTVDVFDGVGRRTRRLKTHDIGTGVQLDLRDLPPGVYYIRVTDGRSLRTRMIIRK
jgi:hypothetical protein